MTTRLVARAVGFEEDDDDQVLEAGFSEFGDGTGFALLFQRTLYEPNDQEIGLGWDTYSLTTGSGKTYYGGLTSVSLVGNRLSLRFAPGAAGVLELDEDVEVELQVDQGAIDEFAIGLRQVIGWGREAEIPSITGF